MPDTNSDNWLLDFQEANSRVHHQAASPVGCPAFVRHICLWETKLRTEEKRSSAIETYLHRLAFKIQKSSRLGSRATTAFDGKPCVTKIVSIPQNFSVEPFVRGKSYEFIFYWCHVRTTLRLLVHVEYITIRVTIDASYAPDGDSSLNLERTQIQHARRLYQEAKSISSDEITEDVAVKSGQFLYTDLWASMDEEILRNNMLLGPIISDYRGIISGPPSEVRSIFKKTQLSRNIKTYSHKPISPASQCGIVSKRLYLIASQDDLIRYEVLASGFLGGRAIYTSALRANPQIAADTNSVHFSMHYTTGDQWELGRLLDTILTLGTLRVAAVYKLNELYRQSGALNELYGNIYEVSGLIRDDTKDLSVAYAPETEVLENRNDFHSTVTDKISQIETKILEINSKFKYGMKYRLERSEYYIQEFYRICPDLKEASIDGYQNYKEFIVRRLGSAFRQIGTIDALLRDVNKNVSTINSQFVASKANSVTYDIRDIAAKTQDEDSEIESIQDFGERILLIALLPYYGSHVISGILAIEEHDPKQGLIWALGALLGLIILAYKSAARILREKRHLKKMLKNADEKKKSLSQRGRSIIAKKRANINGEWVWLVCSVLAGASVFYLASTQYIRVQGEISGHSPASVEAPKDHKTNGQQ